MQLPLYQVSSFTDKIFCGNPACVVPLESWLPDDLLLKIAKENAVAETAFFVDGKNGIHLRWFTPEIEMDLCGHATLATAHCIKAILKSDVDNFVFSTMSGNLNVTCSGDWYTMDLPSRMPVTAPLPAVISESLSIQPIEILKSRDYVLVYNEVSSLENIKIDRQLFDRINLDPGGVIITAKGNDCDFVSRFFTPQASIFEDPVTGSAHCSLVPFWASRLNKKHLLAKQLSERGGTILCEEKGDRVLLSGQAKTYSVGTMWID